MKENVEKLISHYQVELLKEQDKETKDDEKIGIYQKFLQQLKEIVEAESKKNETQSKNNKNKKHKKKIVVQEKIKTCVEPELVPRKRDKKHIDF